MPAQNLRPLVFDLDGTLIDSRHDIAAACNFALSQTGRDTLSLEEICGYVGNGAPYLLSQAFRLAEDSPELEEGAAHFHRYYKEHAADHCTLLPGVAELLAGQSGRRLAICTNKPLPVTLEIVQLLNWEGIFECVIGAEDGKEKKPGPGPLLEVAQKMNVPAADLIMIGDGPQDILAARAVGAYAVGVEGGLLPLERLVESQPDVLLKTLESLTEHLQEASI